ncbi:MAG TPA: HD domain-containing phosphohydrolase [Candidatus Polarisedimenticolaceae bacterium]
MKLTLPNKRRGRILFALLAVLLAVGLAPLAVISWKLIDSSKEHLKTSQQESQLMLASTIAGQLDTHLSGLRAQLLGLSRLLGGEIGPAPGDAETRARRLLSEFSDDRILLLRYSDVKQLEVASASDADVPAELEPAFLEGFVKVAEGLANHRPVDADAVAVSPPVVLPADPPRSVVLLTAPVLAGGVFRGALYAVVDLQGVWDAVVAGRGSGQAVFAVDRSGRLFASRNLLGASPGDDLSPRSGIVKRFRDRAGLQTETMPFLWSDGGAPEWYLGSYELTRDGWGVFVQARESQLYERVHQMIEEAARWALLAISFAILAAVVFAGRLSNPIDRLAEASRAFAKGDFSVRVDVRARNEIGELAETFNAMAAELEEVIRRLRRAAEENNELFLGTARALATAIDAKDPYTRGHSVRVNRYSVVLARYAGLGSQDLADIHVASLLHDVGKIGVDDAILKKPAPLTAPEFEVMKQHTVLGAQIMAPIKKMQSIIPGLRSHHERWRGGGYPDNLQGDAIPLMARIIAVADSFDAMTTDRPYQKGMTFEAAVARINELKGVAFEERIVEAFNRAYRAGEFRPETPAEPAAPALSEA